MGRDWHSIALDYVKEHKVKKKDFGKFVLRISRQFQGNRRLPNLAEGYGANGNIVEHIESHKRSEYGTLLFLCKFINWELNERTDWIKHEDMHCKSLLEEFWFNLYGHLIIK